MSENFMTYEQTMALIGAQRPATTGLLGDVGAMVRDIIGQTGVDGHISLGDVAKAFGVTVFFSAIGPIGTTGLGLCLNVLWSTPVLDFAQMGLGLGMTIGAGVGGKRLAQDYLYVPDNAAPAPPETADREPTGLKIFTRNGYDVLLPGIKRVIIEDMVRETARMFFSGGSKNFSKIYLGKPWGKHLNDAKKTLVKIGYLRAVQNRTYVFTNAARQWLADYC